MPRFYLEQPLAIGDGFDLPPTLAHHVLVLRMQSGHYITLFNGQGGEYTATITALERKTVSVEIKAFSPREAELPYAITLAQALPEAAKMDWIMEKAVELGATAVQPLSAQRCVVRLTAERAAKRLQHWQAIAIAAAEQCGRNRIMHVASPIDVDHYVGQQDIHLRVLLSPDAEVSLAHWARHQPPRSVTLMIGPEGGFNSAEQAGAAAHGVLALSLGARVLRTETAGLAALAALNAIWGEM
ncbi:MAG: 16S rRNA (uracil(1498)-N(3))-methyltransferase [Pseudomonadota bacterium]